MSALGTGFMIVGGYLGIMTFAAPVLASLCLIPVKHELRSVFAWLTFIATGILSLILSPDKEAAFFYIFTGYYPIVKPFFDKIPSKLLRSAAKLALFMLAIGSMYLLLIFVLRLDQVINDFNELGKAVELIFIIGLVLVMMLFDFTLRFAELLYIKRLRPKLGFSR